MQFKKNIIVPAFFITMISIFLCVIKNNGLFEDAFFYKNMAIDYTHVVRSGSISEKVVALTFDDGPHYEFTPQILDLLKKYEAKATFFVLGKQAELYPDIIKRVSEEGHELGNHTYSHVNVRKISKTTLEDEFKKTQDLIYKITGEYPVIFRPPYGYYNDNTIDIASKNKCRIILWTQDARDWSSPGIDKIANTVISQNKNGNIILLHDYIEGESHTIDALKIILPKLKADDYKFVTVSELLESTSEE